MKLPLEEIEKLKKLQPNEIVRITGHYVGATTFVPIPIMMPVRNSLLVKKEDNENVQ